MHRRRARNLPPLLVGGFATVLFLFAVGYHATEIRELSWAPGPLLAMALDTLPALALVYAGYWLTGSEFDDENRWTVCAWTFGGSLAFLTVMWSTIVVRRLEGRAIGEPTFPLLVAAVSGAVAGFIAGYYNARARSEAHEARTVADAFAFVNHFIRHDLRNDLSAIRGHADLIRGGQAAGSDSARTDSALIIGEKADEAMTRIETSGAVAETLVDDPDLERVDLVAVTAEIADRIETAHGTPVAVDLPDRAPVVANAGIRSVVDNLVENAVEHNDADDPRVHVSIGRDDEVVRLTVRDNGPGLPENLKGSTFDGADSLEGGLRLATTLVDRYGGRIRAEDNEPRGSAFVVDLPHAGSTTATAGDLETAGV